MKINTNKKTLSQHINKDFKEYAIYTLESRAIPDFYDCLTNGQKFIVMNAPTTFNKTLTVVGDCISDGYHHGNTSLENSIINITKTFNCSEPILEGDGFFGNAITKEASSPRYTSVRINKRIKDLVSKYSVLNAKKEGEDVWNPLKVDVPIGLVSYTIGISVGYKATILPRRLEDIQDFLDSKISECPPYFMNFQGSIVKNENDTKKSWKILPKIVIDKTHKIINILDISPTMDYKKYIEDSINDIMKKYDCKLINDTKDSLNLKLIFPKSLDDSTFKKCFDEIYKFSTCTITEVLTFIKDGTVLEYDSIEEYLTDFRNYREYLFLEKMEYDLKYFQEELEYLEARKLYIVYMSKKRTEKEVSDFLNAYKESIYNRLDSIKLRFLNSEYLEKTEKEIQNYKTMIDKQNIMVSKQSKKCGKIVDVIENAKISKF